LWIPLVTARHICKISDIHHEVDKGHYVDHPAGSFRGHVPHTQPRENGQVDKGAELVRVMGRNHYRRVDEHGYADPEEAVELGDGLLSDVFLEQRVCLLILDFESPLAIKHNKF